MASGEGTPVSCVRILDVNILICLKTVVGQCKGNGTRREIITPAPDVADFEGKSGAAKHIVQVTNQKVSLSSGIGGFGDKPLQIDQCFTTGCCWLGIPTGTYMNSGARQKGQTLVHLVHRPLIIGRFSGHFDCPRPFS